MAEWRQVAHIEIFTCVEMIVRYNLERALQRQNMIWKLDSTTMTLFPTITGMGCLLTGREEMEPLSVEKISTPQARLKCQVSMD